MTEQEWLACTDPQKMLEFLRGKVSDRKLRLFAVACCRRVAHLNIHPAFRPAVDLAERLAEGKATEEERLKARREVNTKQYADLTTWSAAFGSVRRHAFFAARHALERGAYDVATGLVGESWKKAWELERKIQSKILRCIFGNPLRPLTIEPFCLTTNVTSIAQSIYDARCFTDLPILADAFEDSGCDQAELLKHLREPGEHYRGCWALDVVLGKE